MPTSVQRSLPPMPLKRVEVEPSSAAKADHNEVENDDLSFEEARMLAGILVAAVLRETGAALKEYGDKAQVSRWKAGAENPNLAKLLQRAEGRRAMLKALAGSVRGAKVRTTIELEEVG